MNISKLYLNSTYMALNSIFHASDAAIRVYGINNIPKDQPVLYVINHFTRMETFFLPYIIKKHTDKISISLASHEFFGGSFGKFLGKLGAVSTKDPKRDVYFINSLLTGNYSSIIFPEGQMIKDKKLIEKGKYMVYNVGIRRPPHTGPARIALLAQFYREKIRQAVKTSDTALLNQYKQYLEIPDEEIDAIISKETYIIPVNITYFPIRARENIINRIAEKFINKVPARLEEELQVEGSMLLDGVDIDINFGKKIPVKNHLESKKFKKLIQSNTSFTDPRQTKKDIPIKKVSLSIMQKYMKAIYSLTTLNHDHVFSYILTMSPRNKFKESAIRNKAWMAIQKIKKLNLHNIHTSLGKDQFTLLTDDLHRRYQSFIKLAKNIGIITVENGYIIKNKKRFQKKYKFHTIRKDNMIEVCKNEIEPLSQVINILHKVMLSPPWLDKCIIKRKYRQIDKELFAKAYQKYYTPEETKPKNIGAPFFHKGWGAKNGILLVHGYLAAPEEIRLLSDHLHIHGYTIYGVRLAGHGTSPEDLSQQTWEDWYDSVNRGYIILKNHADNISIVGFSTGGVLALLQAAHKGDQFKSLVTINAPLKLNNIASNFSSAVVFWNKLLSKIHVSKGKVEYVKNNPENPHINYFHNPISGVKELGKLMSIAEKQINKITVPTLSIQGSHDPVVNPVSGTDIFKKISSESKCLFTIKTDRHGIVRGKEFDIISRTIKQFIDHNFNKK